MKHSTLEGDVALCKKYGFAGIEMQSPLLDAYMDCHTLDDLRKLFAESGVKALPVNALTEFNERGALEAKSDRLRYLCTCANAAGADTVILVPAPHPVDGIISMEDTVQAIRTYTAVASQYGVTLALEFLGFPDNSVKSLEDAAAIAEQVPGLRLVLDCAHIMAGPTEPADIMKLNPEKIAIIHIDDLCKNASGIYTDADRVWPGDGDLGLAPILVNLWAIAYSGIVSVELLNPVYWDLPVEEIFKTAMQRTEEFLSSLRRSIR
ncbi:MAG: sugar phosphate isomerase/epimerase [Firmicutes bacterium]|nr:sugar phosphate isomerase/epimerase [Bacillota bacterium]